MTPEEREYWIRLMLQRSSQGEPLVRPSYCPLLSIYSKSSLNRGIKTGMIPSIEIGKSIYVVNSVIADWLVARNMSRHHTMTISPIHQEPTNPDPTKGHPMDDLPDTEEDEP